MSRIDALLEQRLKKSNSLKMSEMALQTVQGNLTSFAGVFSITTLPEVEKKSLKNLLQEFIIEEESLTTDLEALSLITSEVKAITNQAALLHGERIKKAQKILKSYREGAFTAWLMATYGNRQTPYNFLMYYELHTRLTQELRSRLETMPRQAAYTLASRQAPWEEKEKIVESYQGQSKAILLQEIRRAFPLQTKDQRKGNKEKQILALLNQVKSSLTDWKGNQSSRQAILQLLEECKVMVKN